jgi:hypothetical protein
MATPTHIPSGMHRHEVPTVFVHGAAAPVDVQYVEEQLCMALLAARAVHYSLLRIDAAVPGASIVEIEAAVEGGSIDVRCTGTDVRSAGDASVADFVVRIGDQ